MNAKLDILTFSNYLNYFSLKIPLLDYEAFFPEMWFRYRLRYQPKVLANLGFGFSIGCTLAMSPKCHSKIN